MRKCGSFQEKNKNMEGGKLQLQIMLLIGPCNFLYYNVIILVFSWLV